MHCIANEAIDPGNLKLARACRWHTYATRSYDGEITSAMEEILSVRPALS